MECEYKWAAAGPGVFIKVKKALEGENFKETASRADIFDSYFDDDKRTLGARKIALRLRSVNGGKPCYQITLKAPGVFRNGRARRPEETLFLDAKSPASALYALKKLFKNFWPGLNGPVRLFIIKNKRESLLLENPALTVELCFDKCDILTPAKRIKFYEVEMEYKKGSMREFGALAARIKAKSGLEFSKKSKVAAAAEAL